MTTSQPLLSVPGCIGRTLTPGLLPGLAVAAMGALGARSIGALTPSISAAMVAVALGAAMANLGLLPAATRPGLAFAAQRLLRVGVVLLGLRLSVGDIAAIGAQGLIVVAVTVTFTFFGTRLLGRRLGLSRDLSLLVATGYAICGVSAIAAVRDATDADDEEVAAAMALVTLYGSLAMVSLPVMAALVGLGDPAFGLWVGASVHDVAQVVATASAVGPSVLATAVAVKLTRVALLIPIVVGVNIAGARRAGPGPSDDAAQSEAPVARRPTLPLFVIGFLAMVLVRSSDVVPDVVLTGARDAEGWLLTVALVGLGSGIRCTNLRRLGATPVLFGLLAWLLVAAVALVGVIWAG